jgi:hypothetical protein
MTDIIELMKLIFSYIDVPALFLLIMLIGAAWVVNKAQEREDFDFGNMLKDENNKESGYRLLAIASFPFASWYVVYDLIHNKTADPTTFLIYVAIYSGAKVADKAVDALIAKWSK